MSPGIHNRVMFDAWLRALGDFALPARCPGCSAIVERDLFCVECWLQLDQLTGEGCVTCNLPLEAPPGSQCAPCLAAPPRHDGVRAAVAYGPIARELALRLKYGRRTGLAAVAGAALARHVDEPGLLVPVPLHWRRLARRGFNQALLIARAVARQHGLPVDGQLLVRRRATAPLRGLSPAQRSVALRGAIGVRRRLAGETVYLVDDVYTTGATANACAGMLKRAGAGRVIVLAWARVIRED